MDFGKFRKITYLYRMDIADIRSSIDLLSRPESYDLGLNIVENYREDKLQLLRLAMNKASGSHRDNIQYLILGLEREYKLLWSRS